MTLRHPEVVDDRGHLPARIARLVWSAGQTASDPDGVDLGGLRVLAIEAPAAWSGTLAIEARHSATAPWRRLRDDAGDVSLPVTADRVLHLYPWELAGVTWLRGVASIAPGSALELVLWLGPA